ncbi:hypothetical protein N7455_010856 [Penicillium solitum]|uniref:uncharacterized protein n=1 Tax=Penicillium solitum TaxID=60172 RepID=UPI0032C47514|nr:hypothetical protein N7536_008073 [Penicillium majusculum]KAJ5851000.1 hypothetical protein N7455_010856 [Penicillium solitum]
MIPGGAVNNTPRSCVPGFRLLVCSLKMHCIVSGACSLYSFYPLRFAAFHSSFKHNTGSIERGCYCLICGSAGGGLRMRLAF